MSSRRGSPAPHCNPRRARPTPARNRCPRSGLTPASGGASSRPARASPHPAPGCGVWMGRPGHLCSSCPAAPAPGRMSSRPAARRAAWSTFCCITAAAPTWLRWSITLASTRPGACRSSLTSISLPGSETATIDIDSTGRMWLATQRDVTSPSNNREIIVYSSDSPYTAWNGPITLATGTRYQDDISVVTALPNNTIGRIVVQPEHQTLWLQVP